MHATHHVGHAHLGVSKTLIHFREWFSYPQGHQLTREVVCQCRGCQMGKDYPLPNTSEGTVEASFPWYVLMFNIKGSFPSCEMNCFVILLTIF